MKCAAQLEESQKRERDRDREREREAQLKFYKAMAIPTHLN